jgi:hypothetical protein
LGHCFLDCRSDTLHIAFPFLVVDRFKQNLYWLCACAKQLPRAVFASVAGTAAASNTTIATANFIRMPPY